MLAMLALSAFATATEAIQPAVYGVHRFAIGPTSFLLDDQPLQLRSGEMHPSRIPRPYWRHRLQMARAMGLNTVTIYLFWNLHEPAPGEFDWSGDQDIAEFCRLAQAEGLWVVIRPGPYVCAEWDFGGIPWWLLNDEALAVRSRSASFLGPAARYLAAVGGQLASLQVTRGGPILMVQVENEYGMFGSDAEYMGAIRQAILDAGFRDVPLYACNPRVWLTRGYRADLFQVANFGPGIWPKAFPMLREVQTTGPLMSGEYYPGEVGAWGERTKMTSAEVFVGDLRLFLERGVSFNIYMVHGGTTFGLVNGGNTPFKPFITSYDFGAPISENGQPTDKFHACRELFARFLPAGESLPGLPAPIPVAALPAFALTDVAPLMENLPESVPDSSPHPMEHYHQGYGCVVYRTQLPAGPAGRLRLFSPHDFAWCFLDGKRVGEVLDRRTAPGDRAEVSVEVPPRSAPMRLDVLVEAMGRPNFFGQGQLDRKGLQGPVLFESQEGGAWQVLKGWEVFSLPLDRPQLTALRYGRASGKTGPAFWRGRFEHHGTADTFLDLRSWGKGVVWVNGHCLGRFWDIGPQQTLYCPAAWLHDGNNEAVVLDLVGPRAATLSGLDHSILDDLHPEYELTAYLRASPTR